MRFTRPTFFDGFRAAWGLLSQWQVDGLGALITAMESDVLLTDIRQAAYMLATVRWECANSWHPIEEYGKGSGRSYGELIDIPGTDVAQRFYGRGYVQLTWLGNYLKLGDALGMGQDLALHPEKALDPEIAYRIMSYGMRNGTFTGKSLSQYISASGCDYVKSRRIINGDDHAVEIARIAEKFERILSDSLAPDSPAKPDAPVSPDSPRQPTGVEVAEIIDKALPWS